MNRQPAPIALLTTQRTRYNRPIGVIRPSRGRLETLDEYLSRGGSITDCPAPWEMTPDQHDARRPEIKSWHDLAAENKRRLARERKADRIDPS